MNTILVIEKEHSIRKALSYTLEGAEYEVYETESFSEGYELLRSLHFDLLIINFDVLENENLNYLFSFSTPVIFLTDLFGLPSKIAKNLPEFAYQVNLPFPLKSYHQINITRT